MLKDEFLMLMQFLDYFNGFLEEKAESIVSELVDNWYPSYTIFWLNYEKQPNFNLLKSF